MLVRDALAEFLLAIQADGVIQDWREYEQWLRDSSDAAHDPNEYWEWKMVAAYD